MQPTTEFAAIQGIKVPPAVFSNHETFIEATRKGYPGRLLSRRSMHWDIETCLFGF